MGVDFSQTIMVGRQSLNVRPDVSASILKPIGIPREQAIAALKGQWAEPLFALLGAQQVDSIDASDYEQATHIYDFNQRLPMSLMNQFSVVHDGGTIEHVFNIPQAFKNCMEMVRPGGHFIQVSAANNYMGHGFWQFSPELIYRIFSRESGFQIKAVLLHEPKKMLATGASFGTWYKVDDPATHYCRVELTNQIPTYICTIAQKVANAAILARFPQQSDYAEAWQRTGMPQSADASPVHAPIAQAPPSAMRKLVRRSLNLFNKMPSGFERPYYKRVSDDDIVRGRI